MEIKEMHVSIISNLPTPSLYPEGTSKEGIPPFLKGGAEDFYFIMPNSRLPIFSVLISGILHRSQIVPITIIDHYAPTERDFLNHFDKRRYD